MIQTTIFDMLYPKFKIDKPIRLISLFSGYDSQALALKYLGVPFEHYRTCEWAVKSIQALKDLHFTEDNTDYSKDYSKAYLIDYLHYKGISNNYNEPMDKQQIKRLNEKQIRTIYNNIQATHNLVNIQQVKGDDLGIKETDKFCYIMTYSFPCQDLSLAGKGKGMSDTSTRSGMLWEVERILNECNELPQVLLMENVPQVHGEGNSQDFNKWQLKLESLGYKNYWEDLIATDYGIPQTRNRCFMVSILGEYSYSFPPKQELKLRLKDMLEDNVDEKYYLSDKMLQYIVAEDNKYKVNPNNLVINRKIACCKTTREGRTRADASDYVSEELNDNCKLKFHKVLIETLEQNEIKDGINYVDSYNKTIDNSGLSKTISTRVDASNNTYIINKNSKNDLRIRKLTPKECFRLLGVKDEDYEKIVKNQNNASLYHLAGDSIVANVLEAILKEML